MIYKVEEMGRRVRVRVRVGDLGERERERGVT
jgi:hypothetical protein